MRGQRGLFDRYFLVYDVFIITIHISREIIFSKELFLDGIARTFSYVYILRGIFVQSVIN